AAACGLALFLLWFVVPPSGGMEFQPPQGGTTNPVVTTPPAEIPGTLVIVGGGKMPDAVRDRFIDLAGGARAKLVVIPTASAAADGADAEKSVEPWRKYKTAALTLLHTRD